MKIPFENYGGRRWLTGVACLILETVLLCVGKVNQTTFSDLFIWTLGITLGAVVGGKFADIGKKPSVEEK